MALIKKPMTGMKDILPKEMEIRDYLISLIKETYGSFGFTAIETPAVENIANLSSKQGGENEKLIFKILKRGAKLDLDGAQSENDLADGGLRYDLTVPLVRFYSNNSANLPSPFKALQIGPVWRADRPQKGRFRQFYQWKPCRDRAYTRDDHDAGKDRLQEFQDSHKRAPHLKGYGGVQRIRRGRLRYGVHNS